MSTQANQPAARSGPVPDDFEELPPRPRRRLATPPNLALAAILITAAGFIAGVLVEKGQTGGGASATGAGRRGQAGLAVAGGGGARLGAASAGATIGTISSINGRTLYLTDAQGTTIRIDPASGATVVRTASSAVSAIHPGDTAIVLGTRASGGSLTASSIRATAPNAAGGGFGRLAGAGAGAPSPTPPGGGKATATPQLFGPG